MNTQAASACDIYPQAEDEKDDDTATSTTIDEEYELIINV